MRDIRLFCLRLLVGAMVMLLVIAALAGIGLLLHPVFPTSWSVFAIAIFVAMVITLTIGVGFLCLEIGGAVINTLRGRRDSIRW